MKKLLVVRSISGAGKSFLANKLFEQYEPITNCTIFEADNWFRDASGEYVFNGEELGKAHRFCQLSVEYFFKSLVFDGVAIVANTFTTYKEILPYALIADKYGCAVEIVEPQTSWAKDPIECHRRNQHGVPLEVIKNQLVRLEAHPLKVGEYTPMELLKELKP